MKPRYAQLEIAIDERWVAGTYIVSGISVERYDRISVENIQNNIPPYFDRLRTERRGWWPRGICGYYAIPIYCCESFSGDLVEWVQNRPKYRYAMWHEPVLYSPIDNEVKMNSRWGVYGWAFREHLSERLFDPLQSLAYEFGHENFPIVNDSEITLAR